MGTHVSFWVSQARARWSRWLPCQSILRGAHRGVEGISLRRLHDRSQRHGKRPVSCVVTKRVVYLIRASHSLVAAKALARGGGIAQSKPTRQCRSNGCGSKRSNSNQAKLVTAEVVSWCCMLTPVAVRPGSVAMQTMCWQSGVAAKRSFNACVISTHAALLRQYLSPPSAQLDVLTGKPARKRYREGATWLCSLVKVVEDRSIHAI